MQKRFLTLQHIGSALKFIGVIGAIMGFINMIVIPLALSSSDDFFFQLGLRHARAGIGLSMGILLGGLVFLVCEAGGILLYALGECFKVLIAIEENTRTPAERASTK